MAVALLGAIAVSIFSQHLIYGLNTSSLQIDKQLIISQATKLAAIQIPDSFSFEAKKHIQAIITESFIVSYRFVLYCCALCAFISAFIAFLFIRD